MSIDPRYMGEGGMPYNSPEGRAYGLARMELGHDNPDTDAVYERATQILNGEV